MITNSPPTIRRQPDSWNTTSATIDYSGGNYRLVSIGSNATATVRRDFATNANEQHTLEYNLALLNGGSATVKVQQLVGSSYVDIAGASQTHSASDSYTLTFTPTQANIRVVVSGTSRFALTQIFLDRTHLEEITETYMVKAGGYRYGYQSSERDDEVKGAGNSYTTYFRQLDTRLGRWLTIDPKAKSMPWQSPYISMDNNPIWFNDILGDSVGLKNSFKENKTAMRALKEYVGTKEGKEFLARYAKAGQEIAGVKFDKDGDLHGKDVNLIFDFQKKEGRNGGGDTGYSERSEFKDGKLVNVGVDFTVTLYHGKGWATDNWTFNSIMTIFHETFIHVDLFTKDFFDDNKINYSNMSEKDKIRANEMSHHYHHKHILNNHESNTPLQNGEALWPGKAFLGLQKVVKDWNLQYTKEELLKAMYNFSGGY